MDYDENARHFFIQVFWEFFSYVIVIIQVHSTIFNRVRIGYKCALISALVKSLGVFQCYLNNTTCDIDSKFPVHQYQCSPLPVTLVKIWIYGLHQHFIRSVILAMPFLESDRGKAAQAVLEHLLELTILLYYIWLVKMAFDFEWPKLAINRRTKTKRSQDSRTTKPKETTTIRKLDKAWLHHACLYGHKDQVREILKRFGPDIDVNKVVHGGHTALHLACFPGHLSVVQILLSNGGQHKINISKTNDHGQTPLDLAVTHGHKNIVVQLIKDKSFSRKPPVSTLRLAVLSGHVNIAEILNDKLKTNQAFLESRPNFPVEMRRYLLLSKEKTSEETVVKLQLSQKRLLLLLEPVKSEGRGLLPKNNGNVMEEYNCPVCLELMIPPKHILACSNDHLFCKDCYKVMNLTKCPICREPFSLHNCPRRRHDYEKFALRLL